MGCTSIYFAHDYVRLTRALNLFHKCVLSTCLFKQILMAEYPRGIFLIREKL